MSKTYYRIVDGICQYKVSTEDELKDKIKQNNELINEILKWNVSEPEKEKAIKRKRFRKVFKVTEIEEEIEIDSQLPQVQKPKKTEIAKRPKPEPKQEPKPIESDRIADDVVKQIFNKINQID